VAILGIQHQRFIRAPRFDEFDFTPTATPVSIHVPASSLDYEQNDAMLTENTSVLNETRMQLGPTSLGGANASFRKSSVSVGYNDYNVSVDQNGRAYATGDTYGSTHEANMIVSFPLLSKNIKVGVSKSGGTVSRTFRGFIPGSLRAYLWEQMRLRVGIDDGNGYIARNDTTANIFTSRNYASQIIVRNPNHVLADVDLSAYEVYNSWNTAQGRGGGVMITKRSLIGARHYAPNATGHTVMFASPSGAVYTRTIQSVRNISTADSNRDIKVCFLDSELPADIGYARVLPNTFGNYLPNFNTVPRIPCFYSNADKQIKAGFCTIADTATSSRWSIASQVHTGRASHPWYSSGVDGDSGSPSFLIINGMMVVLGLFHVATGGSFVSGLEYNLINSALAASGDSMRLTDIDLSSFTTYSA